MIIYSNIQLFSLNCTLNSHYLTVGQSNQPITSLAIRLSKSLKSTIIIRSMKKTTETVIKEGAKKLGPEVAAVSSRTPSNTMSSQGSTASNHDHMPYPIKDKEAPLPARKNPSPTRDWNNPNISSTKEKIQQTNPRLLNTTNANDTLNLGFIQKRNMSTQPQQTSKAVATISTTESSSYHPDIPVENSPSETRSQQDSTKKHERNLQVIQISQKKILHIYL